MVVDFPAPFGPRSATISPGWTAQIDAVHRLGRAVRLAQALYVDGRSSSLSHGHVSRTAIARAASARRPRVGIRSWDMVSRSRMVTASSSRVSKSTVTQYGVPISSCRR